MIADEHIAPQAGGLAADTLVKTGAGLVYWVAVSAGATGGAFQLNDSTADGGVDRLDLDIAANTSLMLKFDPPIRFTTGIFVDIPGTNLKVNVGHD